MGIVVKLKSERSNLVPLSGNLYSLHGYRVDCSTRGNACAVLAPGKLPNKPVVDLNDYHCTPSLDRGAQGIVLEGKLLECKGCSMVKGLRRGIKHSTNTRADKKLGRVFVDLSGAKVVKVPGGKALYSHRARRVFTVYVGVLYAPQIGHRGNVQAVPL